MEFARRGRSTSPGDDVDDDSRPLPPHGGDAGPAQRDVAALSRKREALLLELYAERIRQEMILRELAETERALAVRLAAVHQPTPTPAPTLPFPPGGWLSAAAAAGDARRGRPPMPPWEEEAPFRAARSSEQRFWPRGSPPAVRFPVYPHVERSPSPTATPKPWPAHDAEQQERGRSSGSSARAHSVRPDVERCRSLWGQTPAVEEASMPTAANANVKPPVRRLFGWEVTPRRQDAAVGQERAAGAEDDRAAQLLHETGNQSSELRKPSESITRAPRQCMPARQEFNQLSPKMTCSSAKRKLTATTSPAKKQKPLGESSNQTCEVDTTGSRDLVEEHWAEQQLHRPNLTMLQSSQRNSEMSTRSAVARPESSHCAHQKRPLEAQRAAMADLEKHLGSRWRRHDAQTLRLDGDKNAVVENGGPQEEDRFLEKDQKKPPSEWNCNVCKARCSSESTLRDHLGGRRHRENMEAALRARREDEEEADEGRLAGRRQKPPSTWSSGVGDSKCASGSDLRDRLSGRRHRESMEAALRLRARGKDGDDEDADQRALNRVMMEKKGGLLHFCEDCGVRCNSEKMLASHLGGRKHRETLQLQGRR